MKILKSIIYREVKKMILDGKKTATEIKQQVKDKVSKINEIIQLVVVLVGENPASQIYVRNKQRACDEVGIDSVLIQLDETITEDELKSVIVSLNNEQSVYGILVQLPLPKHIKEEEIINTIDPRKDVDGFTLINKGKLLSGAETIYPATPKGIITLLKKYNIEIAGKHAVIVGRSNIVGKPMSLLLLQENATVTIAHSKTNDLKSITLQADILISAVGKKDMITSDMVKEHAVVIDVGINRVDKKLYGDVDFEEIKEKASYITPVPGGVGPMTIATLLENVLYCYENRG